MSPYPHEIQRLLLQADRAGAAGDIDSEIELRLQAFLRTQGLPARPVEAIEKAAHLICDLAGDLDDPASDEQWRTLTRHADSRHGIIEGGVLELVRAEQPERAFGLTQRIKSPLLVRRLRRYTLARADLSRSAALYRDALTGHEAVLRRIRQAQREGGPSGPLRKLSTQERRLQNELKRLRIRLREEDPEALAGFGAPLEPDDLLPLFPPDGSACLVDLYMGGEETIMLLAFREGGRVNMVGALVPDLGLPVIVQETRNWYQARYSGNAERMNEGLRALAQFLHDRLMCSLGRFLNEHGHWQVIIVPHLAAHALPLHLAPLCETGGVELFCERFAVHYAPCVQLALTTALRPRPEAFIGGKLPAFLLADPQQDLPAARFEQQRISAHLAQHPWPAASVPKEAVTGSGADMSTATRSMEEAGLVVLGTHARFEMGDPHGSGLVLSGEDGGRGFWTIDEIYTQTHLKHSPVAVLSACESGMSYFDERAEIVALPPALICVGASAVLSSLWPVEDVSTACLVERFVYHLLDPGETPATALAEACKDLRKVTREDAADRIGTILMDMEARDVHLGAGQEAYVRLSALKDRVMAGPDRPFESPLLWGGFFITGCGWRSPGGKGVQSRGTGGAVAMIEAIAQVKWAAQDFAEARYAESAERLRKAIPALDGQWLSRALLMLGDSIYRQPQTGAVFDVDAARQRATEALDVLARAQDLLTAYADAQSAQYCAGLIQTIKRDLGT